MYIHFLTVSVVNVTIMWMCVVKTRLENQRRLKNRQRTAGDCRWLWTRIASTNSTSNSKSKVETDSCLYIATAFKLLSMHCRLFYLSALC